jgi:hypothetical protein
MPPCIAGLLGSVHAPELEVPIEDMVGQGAVPPRTSERGIKIEYESGDPSLLLGPEHWPGAKDVENYNNQRVGDQLEHSSFPRAVICLVDYRIS